MSLRRRLNARPGARGYGHSYTMQIHHGHIMHRWHRFTQIDADLSRNAIVFAPSPQARDSETPILAENSVFARAETHKRNCLRVAVPCARPPPAWNLAANKRSEAILQPPLRIHLSPNEPRRPMRWTIPHASQSMVREHDDGQAYKAERQVQHGSLL